ncbi:MAG: 50S ribosomal protein L25/general stress protein Ctc [Gemmatimonadetes bacterium]|nr:50S ribosomal protein L25/general stress protein Ctc [Gemmatimonadota bacterium]
MATASLSASVRTDTGKGAARKLRAAGSIPAVIYGHGREPQALTTNARETERLLQRIATSSTVIELNVDGTVSRTLIREIQRHPVKRHVMHLDFQELVAGEKVSVKVPIVYIGIPEGVRLEGGILDQVMHELHLQCDPGNIPEHIDVDVSHVKLGKPLHVSDLTLPAGVTVMDEPGATVCVVAPPKVAAEPATEGGAEPELIRKPKGEGEK